MSPGATATVTDLTQYKKEKSPTVSISKFFLPSTGEEFDAKGAEITGKELDDLRQRIEALETIVGVSQQNLSEISKASPENLYQVVGEPQTDKENIPILRIRAILQEGIDQLRLAISFFTDEIVRESHIDVFLDSIRRVALLPVQNRNFQDAVTALIIGLESHITQVYTGEEIMTLQKVTKLLRDNIYMADLVLDQFIDRLEDSGYDLSYPLKGLEFNDLT